MTSIEWTDKVWNAVRGCARVSPGCERCYAERQAHRFAGHGLPYEGLTVLGKHGPRWIGRARFVPDMLGKPLEWRKPQRVFVNSMSDLFHEDVSNEQIAAVFGVMAACPQHTFQVLTKRPDRMLTWFRWLYDAASASDEEEIVACQAARVLYPDDRVAHLSFEHHATAETWPLPNVWLGVSCEDQKRADERIPLLLECPAAVRFVSAEPLIDQLDLSRYLRPTLVANGGERLQHPDPRIPSTGGTWEWGLSWVIVGGESGPGARPCDVQWIRDVVQHCAAAKVPCFVKQLGAKACALDVDEACAVEYWPPLGLRDRKGGDVAEWPKDLRVRQFPEVGS